MKDIKFTNYTGNVQAIIDAEPNIEGTTAEKLRWLADGFHQGTGKYIFINNERIPDSIPDSIAAPVFSVAAGWYNKTQDVAISCPTAEKIYYTTDGSVPTEDSDEYTDPIQITEDTVLRAIGVYDDLSSEMSEAIYTIAVSAAQDYYELVAADGGEFKTGSQELVDQRIRHLVANDMWDSLAGEYDPNYGVKLNGGKIETLYNLKCTAGTHPTQSDPDLRPLMQYDENLGHWYGVYGTGDTPTRLEFSGAGLDIFRAVSSLYVSSILRCTTDAARVKHALYFSINGSTNSRCQLSKGSTNLPLIAARKVDDGTLVPLSNVAQTAELVLREHAGSITFAATAVGANYYNQAPDGANGNMFPGVAGTTTANTSSTTGNIGGTDISFWVGEIACMSIWTNLEPSEAQRRANYDWQAGIWDLPLTTEMLFTAYAGEDVSKDGYADFISDCEDETGWDITQIGTSSGTEDIPAKPIYAMTFGDPTKPNAFLMAGTHANEWVPAYALRAIRNMLANPTGDNAALFAELASRYHWHCIPVGNPWGWDHQFMFNYDLGATDPQANYDATKSQKGRFVAPGTEDDALNIQRDFVALALAETAVIKAYLESIEPVLFLDAHSTRVGSAASPQAYVVPPYDGSDGDDRPYAETRLSANILTAGRFSTTGISWALFDSAYIPYPQSGNQWMRQYNITNDLPNRVVVVVECAKVMTNSTIYSPTDRMKFSYNQILATLIMANNYLKKKGTA